ncbi:MAG: hypothetical protein PHI35_03215 [Victivallaceae bacterium]|nr:hypothetical protein [Victivallaceae bacterium]
MNQSNEMLLEKGRIITVTASIENRMTALGATGTGLREKTESLKSKLSAAAIRNSGYLGMLRNRVAHEPEATLTDEEIANFTNAADSLLDELEKLSGPAAAAVAAGIPPAAQVDTPLFATADDDDQDDDPPPVEEKHHHRRHRTLLEKLAFLPGIHLVFALVLLGRSLRRAAAYLVLAITECAAIWLIAVGFQKNNRPLLIAAAVTGAVCYLGGVIDRHYRHRNLPLALAAIPGVHIIYACVCAVMHTAPVEFLGAAAIGATFTVSVYFWTSGERELSLFFLAASCLTAQIATKRR